MLRITSISYFQIKFDFIHVISIVLLSVDQVGLQCVLAAFLFDQLKAHEPEANQDKDHVRARKKVWLSISWFSSVIALFLLIICIPLWWETLFTSAILYI